MSEPTISEQDFDFALDEFVASCQAMINKHFEDNFPNQSKKIRIRRGGQKYIAIDEIRQDRDTGEWKTSSVWVFVAAKDGYSKAMGHVTKGDVLKPASFKAPAKHARGNIFDDAKGMEHVTSYGAAYL